MSTTLDLNGIKKHWQHWADLYGTDLRATTKVSTAKMLELDALSRALTEIEMRSTQPLTILEAGCGNGQNCLALAKKNSRINFTGIDYIEAMIDAANQLKTQSNIDHGRLQFQVGNVLSLDFAPETFDVIFTDRCIINLNTDELQHQAIKGLFQLLKPNGYLLMIENSIQTYTKQNEARELVGLKARTPAEFNHFIDETSFLPFLSGIGFEVLGIEDFISLHDLVLYVLVPMVNGGEVDYHHPMVEAAAKLNIALSNIKPSSIGEFGQNRFYKCRKR